MHTSDRCHQSPPDQLRRHPALPLPALPRAGSGGFVSNHPHQGIHIVPNIHAAMGSAYLLTLQPTFTQGLILGQVSILVLLFFILKYLFFVSGKEDPQTTLSYQPRLVYSGEADTIEGQNPLTPDSAIERNGVESVESADWMNIVLQQVSI